MTTIVRRHRRLTVGVATMIGLAAACSSDDSPDWSADAVEIGDADTYELDTSAFRWTPSPDGRQIASIDDGQICIRSFDDSRPGCADVGDRITERGITWSDDGSTVLLAHEYVRFLAEPDVIAVDAETLDVDVITDDDTDDVSDGDAQVDQAPFVGPDGAIYFFRSPPEELDFELFRTDVDARDASEAEQVESVDLPRRSFPIGPVRQVDDGRWMLVVVDDELQASLYVFDLDDEERAEISLGLTNAALVDVSNGVALVADITRFAQGDGRYLLVDIDAERDREIDVELEERQVVTAAGFSPDGSSVLVARDSFGGDGADVLAIPIADGRAVEDETETLLRVRDFDGLTDDENLYVSGLGEPSRIVWTADGTLVVSSGSRLITFETTPG